jgi:hypothetical protein
MILLKIDQGEVDEALVNGVKVTLGIKRRVDRVVQILHESTHVYMYLC